MTEHHVAGPADDVLSLCRALRDATGMLGLRETDEATLFARIALAEDAATATPPDLSQMISHVRAIRYQLIEVADGPISAFMADDAARILGDGIGRLFS
jgi:hypothetical protein